MIEISSGAPVQSDLLVVPVLTDRTPATESELAVDLDDHADVLDARDFSGKSGQMVYLSTPGGLAPEVLLVGLGDEADLEGIRQAAGSVARSASGYETIATLLHDVGVDGAAGAVVLGTQLGAYRFDEYRSKPKDAKFAQLVLVGDELDDSATADAAAIADAVILCRDLVNRPAADKPPSAMADIASGISGVDVTVYEMDEIVAKGFGGLLAVNAGADRPPRMVVMEYRPEGATKTLALVGKGIVFDSGGLSIKPASGMETMKTDMAGAAAVIGAMKAISTMGIDLNVIGITPLTENMTGGSATKPGDVMRAYNGKTIEILNTDAEGRLVLADGLSLAVEFEPDLIVDIATLTGTAKAALGTDIAALFAVDDDAAALVEGAAHAAGEKVWRLPLDPSYRKLIDSDIADMKNTGGRWGGAITAALLLQEFVDDVPWVHLDVAGPARADSTEHYVSKGGSGFGVRTLVAIAEAMA